MRHHDAPNPRRERRPPRPLDAARLDELALTYVARFATTAARLEAYLRRKLAERGWDGPAPADPAAVAARCVQAGYVDDAAYARMKQGSLLRRGYGPRRVAQALALAGVADDVRQDMPDCAADARRAALALAAKRRFGPFGPALPDRPTREKQIAAMLRAGHALDTARRLVEAQTIEQAERWACPGDETPCD